MILKSLKKNCLTKTFYTSSNYRKITDKDYEHALNVWKKFAMKKMKDYHDLYLKCDVLLSADQFEKFRNNSVKNYGLCPDHYLSAPGLSWDAMLKITKIEPELIPDPEVKSLIFLIGIAKPAINIRNIIETYYILRRK